MNKAFLKIISILVAAFLITWTFSCTNPGSDSSSEEKTPEVKYTITFKANHVSATGSTASVTAAADTTVTLTANGFNLEGYNFTSWNTTADGTGTSYAEGAKLKLTGDLTLYAQWELATVPTYKITIVETEHGTVTASQSVSKVGAKIWITVMPDKLYALNEITVKDAENNTVETTINPNDSNVYTFLMPDKNVIVTVTFKYIAHSITIDPVENGTVTANESVAVAGTEIFVTLSPNQHYGLDSIIIKDSENNTIQYTQKQNAGNVYSFTMPDKNVIVMVVYRRINYSVSVLPTQNGSVKVGRSGSSSNLSNIPQGEEIVITLTPNKYYAVDSIIIKDESNNQIQFVEERYCRYSFTMPNENVTIEVTFKYDAYRVFIAPTENGSVTTSVDIQKQYDYVSFTIKPDKYYKVDKIKITDENNNSVPLKTYYDNKGSFVMPSSDVTINVTFIRITYWVKFSSCNMKNSISQYVQAGDCATPISLETDLYLNNESVEEITTEDYLGWFSDGGLFDFNTPIEKNTEISAGWRKLICNGQPSIAPGVEEIKIIGRCYSWPANYFNWENRNISLDLSEINFVSELPKNMFENCVSLEKIILPDDCKWFGIIYGTFFKNCSQLKSVNIPSNVKYIYANAFEGCDSLEEVIFQDTEHQWVIITDLEYNYNNKIIGPMSATDLKSNADLIKLYSEYQWRKKD